MLDTTDGGRLTEEQRDEVLHDIARDREVAQMEREEELTARLDYVRERMEVAERGCVSLRAELEVARRQLVELAEENERLAALRACAERAKNGSELERQMAGSVLVEMVLRTEGGR